MPRPLRLQFEDAFYHVFNRGNRRARLFHDVADYREFEELLLDGTARDNVHLYQSMVADAQSLSHRSPNPRHDFRVRHAIGFTAEEINSRDRRTVLLGSMGGFVETGSCLSSLGQPDSLSNLAAGGWFPAEISWNLGFCCRYREYF